MKQSITASKARRLERNAKIKEKYELAMLQDGAMKSAVISNIAKSYGMSIPTVYSIIN